MAQKTFCDECAREITASMLMAMPVAMLRGDPENKTGKDLCGTCFESINFSAEIAHDATLLGHDPLSQVEAMIARQQPQESSEES